MTTQPEALRLADELEAVEGGWHIADACCAELRRLYAENEGRARQLKHAELAAAAEADEVDRLKKERAELKRDAERYRLLRDKGEQGFPDGGVPQRGLTVARNGSVVLHFTYWISPEELNETIDAMKGQQ